MLLELTPFMVPSSHASCGQQRGQDQYNSSLGNDV